MSTLQLNLKDFDPRPEFLLAVDGRRDYNNIQHIEDEIVKLGSNELNSYAVSLCSTLNSTVGNAVYDFASKHGIKFYPFLPDWQNLLTPNAVPVSNKNGQVYNRNAGRDAREKMAIAANGLLLFENTSIPGLFQDATLDDLHELMSAQMKDIRIVRLQT